MLHEESKYIIANAMYEALEIAKPDMYMTDARQIVDGLVWDHDAPLYDFINDAIAIRNGSTVLLYERERGIFISMKKTKEYSR